ncbi:MAG: Ig-like domain-containing protein, partial [Candidatus Eisenbacteria bacterium]|nr:Ig-like domain-containing protein [Candidatus Eisenbacteria bacterium]
PDPTGVSAPSAPIVVVFDEPVQGSPTWTVRANGNIVTGLSKVADNRAVFTPLDPFTPCDEVAVELTGGVTDASGNVAESRSWQFDVACQPENVAFIQAPVSGRYMLMTVPVYATGKPSELLSELGPTGESTWRAFGWNGSAYEEDPDVGPGDGFWIAGTSDVFDGGALSLDGVPHGDAMRIPLDAGWNLIGVPKLGQTMNWNDVLVITATGVEPLWPDSPVSAPVYYSDPTSDFVNNGGYTTATRLNSNAYGGYWIHADEACELLFAEEVGPRPAGFATRGDVSTDWAPATSASEWTVELRASSGVQGDGGILIGTRKGALPGADRTDVPKPPVFQQALSLTTSVLGSADPYLVSFQAATDAELEWTLRAEGDTEFVDLHWSEIRDLPDGLQLYLFDENDRLLAEVSGEGSYRVVLGGSRELVLRATPIELDAPTPGMALRVQPNPVRDASQLFLQLDHAKKVSLRIVDVSGRTVSVIHEGALDGGEHIFDWEPGASGSGVYFLRGFVDSEAIHTKILIIK